MQATPGRRPLAPTVQPGRRSADHPAPHIGGSPTAGFCDAEAVRHVVVVGGGFGGLLAVRGLRQAEVRVTLVDRQNFFLFQPLVYQVATWWNDIGSALSLLMTRSRIV